jgi:hypothetical protein
VLLSHRGAEYAIYVGNDVDDAIIFLSASRPPDNSNDPEYTWEDRVTQPNTGTPSDTTPHIDPSEF